LCVYIYRERECVCVFFCCVFFERNIIKKNCERVNVENRILFNIWEVVARFLLNKLLIYASIFSIFVFLFAAKKICFFWGKFEIILFLLVLCFLLFFRFLILVRLLPWEEKREKCFVKNKVIFCYLEYRFIIFHSYSLLFFASNPFLFLVMDLKYCKFELKQYSFLCVLVCNF